MPEAALLELVTATLDDMKARDLRVMDVTRLTTITDHMVIATGASTRQVKAMSDRLLETVKRRGVEIFGVEGLASAEWVVIDLGSVVVHAMLPATRAFYQLEKLWDNGLQAARRS